VVQINLKTVQCNLSKREHVSKENLTTSENAHSHDKTNNTSIKLPLENRRFSMWKRRGEDVTLEGNSVLVTVTEF
jgi:hypothetical protein